LPSSFGFKLNQAFEQHGQLCVGIDPHESLFDAWGLDNNVQGLDYFANKVVELSAGLVGIIKPQVSFFERFGSEGFRVLEITNQRATDAGLVVISDAKRGDIGSTMIAYLDAWLGRGSSFASDALTVNPFLGLRTASDFMQPYLERGKGVFALVATSNPEGASVQLASRDSQTVSEQIWNELHELNQVTSAAGDRFGSFGAVLGATLDFRRFGIRLDQGGVKTPILAPGFGAQGAHLRDVRKIFGDASGQVIANVSRSVLESGQQAFPEAVKRAADDLRSSLRG
jgi:orotidine-5'-phosphate decarboxylase